jgi:hypothetical protein
MNGERARACPRSQPIADEFAAEPKRTPGTALVGRPLAPGDERAVGDANSREVEDRSELERKAGAARMVAAGRVDENDIRQLWQRTNGGFHERTLAEGEQARPVRRSCLT